ncbi:MAG TPA: hypothetical protein GXX17_06340 [Clostridiales bacterium]|nr:hypothetical protein [Clostridiales bacterium]
MKKCALKSVLSLFVTLCMMLSVFTVFPANAAETTTNLPSSQLLDNLMEVATQFIVIRHYQLGGSHYAYTEGLAEEMGNHGVPDGTESNFIPGSQMILVTLRKSGSQVTKTEEVLIDSSTGVVRDPDVSEDGRRVVFSWKKDRYDDYHLYEMTLADRKVRQLTFGSGIADFEPQYLPNGNIIFSSSRTIQTVDCWKTPVSNLYICGPNGENIVRVGYDQVHTTFPTTTEDGRVLYTRWDYNDRNQMFVQGVFQMQQDGTNQTEVFGNDTNFPTTLLHTREVPGIKDKYITIVSGHHVKQAGKLAFLDTSVGRNSPDAVQFIFPDSYTHKNPNTDVYGQSGPLYKYPYAISATEFLVSYAPNGWTNGDSTPFSIYLMNTSGQKVELVSSSPIPASQIVPIKTRNMTERPSSVDYSTSTGVFYIGNIYEGEGLKGVEPGTAKYIRVVALDYRPYAIGATVGVGTGTSDPYTPISTGNGSWDVKQVLGIVPIEEDGSAMFKVPALKPVFFQVLDENGELIQSMRSWSTLMPNETFSCVGCHEDKNTVPPAAANMTIAMKKGPQPLQKDFWMTGEKYEDYDPYEDEPIGFDYLEEVQPILDENCVQCHNNIGEAYDRIRLSNMNGADPQVKSYIIEKRSEWKYTTSAPKSGWTGENFDDSDWKTGYAPFGTSTTSPGEPNTIWSDSNIYMRKSFVVNRYQLEELVLYMDIAYNNNPTVMVNGKKIWSATGSSSNYVRIKLTDEMKSAFKVGHNLIAVQTKKGSSGQFIDLQIVAEKDDQSVEFIPHNSTWKYRMSTTNNPPSGWNQINFDDSSWQSGVAPFGDRAGYRTSWTGANNYIWIRHEFTIDNIEEFKDCILYTNTWYDDTPEYYINGVKVFSDSAWVDNYVELKLPEAASNALVQGKNVFAIKCQNTAGGRQIEASLRAVKRTVETIEILPIKQSGWKYVINNKPSDDWYKENFNDSSWQTGTALFGSDGRCSTYWGGDNSDIWIRRKFTVSDVSKLQGKKLYLNIFYDEDPQVYINGTLVATKSGYTTDYVTIPLPYEYTSLLKNGENTIAVKAHNSIGGSFIDVGIYAQDIETPVSFENINIIGYRMKRYFPLSYLVLTGSTPSGGSNWLGDSVNSITNWISGMSQCEILEPYQFGSSQSRIIKLLREGHQGVELSEEEIRTIAAWIDLGVPAYGRYDANDNWDNDRRKEAQEEQNKRNVYVMLDKYARKARANGGTLSGAPVSIRYTSSSNGKTYETTGNELAVLYTDVKYNQGDTVRIQLPEGEKYLMVSLNAKMGEALVYCPNGVFNYTFPDLTRAYNITVNPTREQAYVSNMITARVATEEDLKKERNLAFNPYDLTGSSPSQYPHVTESHYYNNQSEFAGRNIIDGMTGMKGHGSYPHQSWGPNQTGEFWVNIDLGREATVRRIEIYIRADFPHDTYYTSGELEFSDGTTQQISLIKTDKVQVFEVPNIKTSSVKIKNLKTANVGWAGLVEVKVIGTQLASLETEYELDDNTNTISKIDAGTDINTFKSNIKNVSVKVMKDNKEVTQGPVATGMTVEIEGKTYTLVVTGDANGDGNVTVSDIIALRRIIMGYDDPPLCNKLAADLDKSPDGSLKLTVTDVVALRRLIMAG